MRLAMVLCGALLACAGATPGCAGRPARADAPDVPGDSSWMQLELLDGTGLDLSTSFGAGRRVALVFWQTWCAACAREAPALARAAGERAGEVDFVGVVTGPDDVVDEGEVRRMAQKLGLPYPQARDRSAALARRFGVQGTPTIVVVEPTGRVAYNGHELPPDWAPR